jgi:mRNA interferase MazF
MPIIQMMPNVPKEGDIIWIDFDPQAGVEIKKRRPALVVSKTEFQERTGLVVVVPITSTVKEFPLHVNLSGCKTTGDILCEQPKSFDFTARNWQFIEKLPELQFIRVKEILSAILDLD